MNSIRSIVIGASYLRAAHLAALLGAGMAPVARRSYPDPEPRVRSHHEDALEYAVASLPSKRTIGWDLATTDTFNSNQTEQPQTPRQCHQIAIDQAAAKRQRRRERNIKIEINRQRKALGSA